MPAGVKKVIIRALMFVKGDNFDKYKKIMTVQVSNASCSTNYCKAPLMHIISNQQFGLEHGLLTTVHAVTQHVLDGVKHVISYFL